MLKTLDHIAILVKDTDEALRFYEERLGLPLLFSEVLDDQGIRLTHLGLGSGGVHLQLVQPLRDDHPLQEALRQGGERLHHLCFQVDSVPEAMAALPEQGLPLWDAAPRSGPRGRQAAFLDPGPTRGVLFEITADPTKGSSGA